MATRLTLWRELFNQQPRTLLQKQRFYRHRVPLPERRGGCAMAGERPRAPGRTALAGQMIWDATSTVPTLRCVTCSASPNRECDC